MKSSIVTVIASYHGTVHTCISALNCRQLLFYQRLDLSTYVCPALRALAQHALGKCIGSMPSRAKLGWLILGGFQCTLHFDEPEKEDSMRRA